MAAAKKPDLATYSLVELREVVTEATALIAVKAREEKDALRAKFEAEAKAAGFASLDEVMGGTPAAPPAGKRGRSKGTVSPKYRNPADPAQTWTGRGRQPVFVREHVGAGGKLEDLAIG